MIRANQTPMIKTMRVAMMAVLKDSHSGEKFISIMKTPPWEKVLLVKTMFFQNILCFVCRHIIEKFFSFFFMIAVVHDCPRIDDWIVHITFSFGCNHHFI